jgi:hypothetical protein
MKNAFLIFLIFAGCQTSKISSVKFDKKKLLLSEIVSFTDTSNSKRDTLYKIDYSYDSLDRVIKVIIYDIEHHTIKSSAFVYDTNNNLIEKQEIDSGKTDILDYTYVNGLPLYSKYRNSGKHYEDFIMVGTKTLKRIFPQENTIFTDTYDGNNLIKGIGDFPKFHLENTYKYGYRRSEYYGQNSKWPYLTGPSGGNEVLQVKILRKGNNYEYDDHDYTYNKYGYPIKDIQTSNFMGHQMSIPIISYYKYILPHNK